MSHLRKSQSAKNLVGSIHAPTATYHRDTQAFDSSLIPDKAKQAADQMRYLTSKDILGNKPPEWNSSTFVSRSKAYFDQIPQSDLLFQFRAGLHDHYKHEFRVDPDALRHLHIREGPNDDPKLDYIKAPILPRPAKVYPGTETRDDYRNWNVSTYVEPKEIKQRLENLTEKAIEKTKKSNEALLKGYLKPPMAQTQMVKMIREEKVADEELRRKIREQYLYECPKSSMEKTAAEVFKRVAEHKLKVKQGEVAVANTTDETFKPMMSTKLKSNLEKVRMHDGAWGVDCKSGDWSWSCCMSEDFKSAGCVEKVRNKDRWIVSSI